MVNRLRPRWSLGLLLAVTGAAAGWAGPGPLAGKEPDGGNVVELKPFPVDHALRRDSDADVRFLLDAPAGKHGAVHAANGHLYGADGTRLRFWGITLAGWTEGSALLPPKPDIDGFVAELPRLGINCVRFLFLDFPKQEHPDQPTWEPGVPQIHSPDGLIDGTRDDTRRLDPGQLDLLDYFVAKLKERGIYTDLNLNIDRRFKAGDGVPDYDLIGVGKAVTYFQPRIVELERERARQLLTHRNAYTGMTYAEDPAVAVVEIVNENSPLEFWMRNWFRGDLKSGAPHYQLDLTPAYKALLTTQYNDWLARHRTPAQLASLRKEAGVAAGQPVPLMRRQEFGPASRERFYTEGEFLTHVETSFLTEMQRFLKQDLGVKGAIIGTNDHTYSIPGMPLLRSTSKEDIIDGHAYWQHPAIYGRRNTPMVDDPLHSLPVKLTRSAMVGKPFTVSEVNEPFPSDYACELIPILAAYGSFQDWDGIFLYAMEPKLTGKWTPLVGDDFDISQNPVAMAQMEMGALLFLRQDVHPAKKTVERTYSSQQIYESMRLPQSDDPYSTPGFPLSLALKHGARVRSLDSAPTPVLSDTPGDAMESDTGELVWRTPRRHGGVVTVDSPRTTALVGFVRDNGASTSHLSVEVANRFCAITLSSMDDRPIVRSSRLLLTTAGRMENTGQVWNARRSVLDQWGGPPTEIEPIRGWVLLKDLEGAVAVTATALDGSARPIRTLSGRMLESGWEIPIGEPATTTYVVHVVR